jgi:hypothetical protein
MPFIYSKAPLRWARWPAAWLLVWGSVNLANCQVKLKLTARVDTTQADTRAVYQLLSAYLNASPDSLYSNPCWNAAEVNYYVAQRHEKVDLAAPFLFSGITAKQTFATYQPTVLSIEPVGAKYVTRVLLYAEQAPEWVKQSRWNPPVILRYYAVQEGSGRWKPENSWPNILPQWQEYATPWIRFHYPPTFTFHPGQAARASTFCDSVVAALHLTSAQPFDFYVMNSEEELGRLFNMEYWLAYNTGFTQKAYNRTLSGRGREQHLHEFMHMLYHPVKNYFLAEGIATYLGGVDGHTPYQQTLRELATDLRHHHPAVTFETIYSNKFKYPLNSNPQYAAGALVYELVYRRAGLAGFAQLEASENTYVSLLRHFAAIMQLRPEKAEAFLMQQLLKASQ